MGVLAARRGHMAEQTDTEVSRHTGDSGSSMCSGEGHGRAASRHLGMWGRAFM